MWRSAPVRTALWALLFGGLAACGGSGSLEAPALQRIWEDRIPALNQQVRDSAIDAIVVDAD